MRCSRLSKHFKTARRFGGLFVLCGTACLADENSDLFRCIMSTSEPKTPGLRATSRCTAISSPSASSTARFKAGQRTGAFFLELAPSAVHGKFGDAARPIVAAAHIFDRPHHTRGHPRFDVSGGPERGV